MTIIKPHLVHPGDRFGRFTVIAFTHNDKRHRRHYSVVCDCGTMKNVQGTLLRTGNTRSCGCLGRDTAKTKVLPNDGGMINQIILQYKRHARDRGIAWELSPDDVDGLVRWPCHYCGDAAGNLKKSRHCPEGFAHTGIDRKDRNKPYSVENCVPCCGKCNMAKGKMSEAEFIALTQRIADQWGALDTARLAA